MAKIHKSQFIQDLARAFQAGQDNEKYAGLPRGPLRGTVVDVNDPKKLGRICVIFDDMNPDCPQSYNTGKLSERREGEEPDRSHWIDVTPPFKGLQPRNLLGKRVNILPSNGQYNFAVAAETIFDPPTLAEEAAKKMKMPPTSTMTRLPVYEPDEIPPPCEENHGCLVIENNGPMSGDWMCVCVKRDGKYYWVRVSDLAHGHAGGNDGTQQVDSSGNRQNPVMQGTIGDNVFPTTHQQFTTYSDYTTKPQGNPKGNLSHWYPAPQSGDKYKPGKDFSLLNPLPDIALNAVRKPAGFPGINSSIRGFVPTFNPDISTILEPKAVEALKKAQGIAKRVSETTRAAQQALNNPQAVAAEATKLVSTQALSTLSGENPLGIPPASQVALGSIPDASATLPTTLPVPSKVSIPSQILSSLKNIIGFG
jgi:hypothetical protein